MTRRALIVMAKRPAAGRTKTRLSPPLSAAQAAELYACLLHDTLEAVRAAANLVPLTPCIAYAPADAAPYFRDLAPDFTLIVQQGPNLGHRLASVMLAARDQGHQQVAAINSDSPGMPPAYLAQAFSELDDPAVDVVLGPVDDGGYYLIGWQRPYPRLVREVTMSTTRVLADTLALAVRVGARTALLPGWYDVDTAADIERLRANGHMGHHTNAFFAEQTRSW
jgi:rSAM/selenodomain-associated transferase 1